MATVVFLKYSPLTAKVYEDCCFKALFDAGFTVEYWNITELFNIYLPDFESYKPTENIAVRNILSYDELDRLVKDNLSALFVSLMTCEFNQAKIFRVFTSNNVKTAFWGPDPVYVQKSSFNRRFRRVTLKKILGVIENYLMHILLRINVFHYYDYYFSVGNFGYRQIGIFDNKLLSKSTPLPINSFDYNRFHYKTENTIDDEKDCIVFIDQYLPMHPDNIITGRKSIPVNDYYDRINVFFDFIEKHTGKKVIIAAHPKAQRYHDTDFFRGRKVVFNQACSLIKNASLVLGHFSTAIDYAVMSYKPILLLNSRLFEDYCPSYSDYVSSIAERIGSHFIYIEECECISNNEQLLNLSSKQRKLYCSFVNVYCSSPGLSKPNEVLILDYLRKYF